MKGMVYTKLTYEPSEIQLVEELCIMLVSLFWYLLCHYFMRLRRYRSDSMVLVLMLNLILWNAYTKVLYPFSTWIVVATFITILSTAIDENKAPFIIVYMHLGCIISYLIQIFLE